MPGLLARSRKIDTAVSAAFLALQMAMYRNEVPHG
jgi:hypothetical protein